MNGLLLMDKPAGITSFEVVRRVRRALKVKKVGQLGTMDPFATGLLPVAVGEGTKLAQFMLEEPKTYRAILKLGEETDTQDLTGQLCFKCHTPNVYATRADIRTDFWLTDINKDGHSHHADRIGRMRCSWCHTVVPHGWKNKALLVNLNDVGPEAGAARGTQVRNNTTAGYSQAPYSLNAMVKVRNFKASGQWTAADCGSAGAPGNGQSGRAWMRDSNENCSNPP